MSENRPRRSHAKGARPKSTRRDETRRAEDHARRRADGCHARPKSPSWKPSNRYLQGYRQGFRQGSFEDGAQQGYDDGYYARRNYDTDDDEKDDIAVRENIERKRRDVMDDIEKLTQPGERLTKEHLKRLVNDYRESGDEDEDDEDDDKDDEDDDIDDEDEEEEDTDESTEDESTEDDDTEDDEDKNNKEQTKVTAKSVSILRDDQDEDDDEDDQDEDEDEDDDYDEDDSSLLCCGLPATADDEWREW